MKALLEVKKDGDVLHSAIYDIDDTDGFGRACAAAWSGLRQRQLDNETSIGALMEHLDWTVLDQLSRAQITVTPIQ